MPSCGKSRLLNTFCCGTARLLELRSLQLAVLRLQNCKWNRAHNLGVGQEKSGSETNKINTQYNQA